MHRPTRNFLVAAATALTLSLAPCMAWADASHPAPWVGAGLDASNDGRAHTYYYRLPLKLPHIGQQREVTLRVLSRGGTTTARLVDNAVTTSSTYLTVAAASASAAAQADTAQTARVGSAAPVLVVQVPANVTHWAVMVDDHMAYEAPRAPQRPGAPSPGPAPTEGFAVRGPAEPGAQPWSGSFAGPFAENRPMYFYVNHPGGPLRLTASIVAHTSAEVTACIVDPAATTGAEFDLAHSTAFASSRYGGASATGRETAGPLDLARGRYTLRIFLTNVGSYTASVTTR